MNLRSASLDRTILAAGALLAVAIVCSLALMPRMAHAAVAFSAVTSTSTPAYTNTGLATTTRAKLADLVQYQLTLTGGPPLIAPQINILGMGSTTMSGATNNWWYSTTTSVSWSQGPISFKISVGGTTGVEATTTVTQASITGTNVTYDSVGPTLNSVSWGDDGSTQFSAGDTLVLTFNETMATSTITTGNVDTTLALSGSHTFGTSPTVSWNTAGTVLTLTLGTSPTLATGDTINPTTAVKDAIGNNDATVSDLTITDNVSPLLPTGLADEVFYSTTSATLVSTGSTLIRYTIDGSTPDCSTGTLYSSTITISASLTLKAAGCDEAGNVSTVATAIYGQSTGSSHGGGGGHSSSGTSSTTTTVTQSNSAIQAQINALLATLATLQAQLPGAGDVMVSAFARDLTVGAKGADVRALQLWLNTHGFAIASTGPGSAGNETDTFGGLTRAALAKYQASVGITPAAGYFGPKTRASLK